MKKMILLICLFLLLTACNYDEEAKRIKNSNASKKEIKSEIIQQMKEDFGMNVYVDIRKLKFSNPKGAKFPFSKTDKRLEVPVKADGSPPYEFKVYIPIYDESKDKYILQKDKLEFREFFQVSRELLTDVFEQLYEQELNKITEFDNNIEIEVRVSADFTDRHFVNKAEEKALLKMYSKDYHAGNFEKPQAYASLINKYAASPNEESLLYTEQIKADPPCTPEVKISGEYALEQDEQIDEKLASLINFIENEARLPNASYDIHVYEEDPDNPHDKESSYDLVLKCNN